MRQDTPMDGTRPPPYEGPPFVDGAEARDVAYGVVRTDWCIERADRSTSPPGNTNLLVPPAGTAVQQVGVQTGRPVRAALQRILPRSIVETTSLALQHLGGGEHRRRLVRNWRMNGRSTEVDPFGFDPAVERRFRSALDLLYHGYWRVSARGIANIPARGRALLVANHGGTLPFDALMVARAVAQEYPTHRTVRPLIDDGLFYAPYLGAWLNRLGCVRACQKNAERLLDQEALVLLFPEGAKGRKKPSHQRRRLQRFGRGGFIKLALRTQTPIVPVALTGPEQTVAAVPLPSHWRMDFAPSIELWREHQPEAEHDPVLVSRLTEQVRSQIQRMLDALAA